MYSLVQLIVKFATLDEEVSLPEPTMEGEKTLNGVQVGKFCQEAYQYIVYNLDIYPIQYILLALAGFESP